MNYSSKSINSVDFYYLSGTYVCVSLVVYYNASQLFIASCSIIVVIQLLDLVALYCTSLVY